MVCDEKTSRRGELAASLVELISRSEATPAGSEGSRSLACTQVPGRIGRSRHDLDHSHVDRLRRFRDRRGRTRGTGRTTSPDLRRLAEAVMCLPGQRGRALRQPAAA